MPECLYHLHKDEYLKVTNYLRETGTSQWCACKKCLYHAKRIEAKTMVPLKVYNSGTFQQSLRMVNGVPHREFAMTHGEIDTFVRALFGLGE